MNRAKWQKPGGKKIITGSWEYYRPGDFFRIYPDGVDDLGNARATIITHEDAPEWGRWKRVTEIT